jgi:hypothetical protein
MKYMNDKIVRAPSDHLGLFADIYLNYDKLN